MPHDKMRGNMLLTILIGIAIVAALTYAVTQSSQEQSDTLTRQTVDDGASRVLAQESVLHGAVQQMVNNGEDAATLYTFLSLLRPGDAGYETAPHKFKIYHPYGGGISYQSDVMSGTDAVATNMTINPGSIVTGVGATNVAVGDILFTAQIASEVYCARLNTLTNGSAVIPILATADFDALFTAGTTVTISGANCAGCVNKAKLCVANTPETAWGYYASLLPG